ncbi:MAG: arabinan endo-1,5-alpha-L-arabinosidase [Cucumibacter sp.]
MRTSTLFLALVVLALGGLAGSAQERGAVRLTGNTGIHDPTMTAVAGGFVAFGTGVELAPDGGAIRLKTSTDGIAWADAGTLTQGLPEWIAAELGFSPRNIWAPSISMRAGVHYLYYSASSFGVNTSAIGLATNDSLDLARPAEGWTDRGLALRSHRPDNFNAIDPARIDSGDGRAWLAFGSFWDGIRLVELDPVSGLRRGNEAPIRLASRGGGAIEAPSIIYQDAWFYLFVSFDRCCAGLASTYRVMVGRARDVTGPYADAAGVPMLDGGGTELVATQGRYVGPGGQEAIRTPAGDVLVFHYYDREAGGAPKLQIMPIEWGADGWPHIGVLP